MKKNLKKLLAATFFALNIFLLNPHVFCTPGENPFNVYSVVNNIKENLEDYEFSDAIDFKNHISFNRRYIDLKSSKINIEMNGIITVSLVYYNGFKEKVYFNIPELSLTPKGLFRITRGIEIFNKYVAMRLNKHDIKGSDLYGCLIVPEKTKFITRSSFKGISNNVMLIYIPKHVKVYSFSFCNCSPNIKVIVEK